MGARIFHQARATRRSSSGRIAFAAPAGSATEDLTELQLEPAPESAIASLNPTRLGLGPAAADLRELSGIRKRTPVMTERLPSPPRPVAARAVEPAKKPADSGAGRGSTMLYPGLVMIGIGVGALFAYLAA